MSDDIENSEWGRFLKPSALPSEDDKLFKGGEDWWNNAFANFFPGDWYIYATGYKDSADILVAHVEEHQIRQDALVYPVVFLYRQYLEIAIKTLIRQARRLQDISEPIPMTHHINELWKVCSDLLREISPGDSEEEQNQIGRLIEEFCNVDPTSTAFRYPEDWDGDPSLPPGIRHINLRNVTEVIDKISVILNGADAQIDEYLSNKADIYSGLY